MTPSQSAPHPQEVRPIAHYENFPVASVLCPPRLRAPIAAIYHFARTADDIADEGDAPAQQRLDDLAAYRGELQALQQPGLPLSRWPEVFEPLGRAVQQHQLPIPLLADLLDAFSQDVRMTRDGARYADMAELLDYCRRSANPVGRLLLHLYGVHDAHALDLSDAICSALQLINFWQDLSVDLPRARHYLPVRDCTEFGVTPEDLEQQRISPNAIKLIAHHAQLARAMMQKGAPLVHHLPGRAGWELRLVVQGGLRMLDKIDALHGASLLQRPRLRWWDVPVLLWRSLWM